MLRAVRVGVEPGSEDAGAEGARLHPPGYMQSLCQNNLCSLDQQLALFVQLPAGAARGVSVSMTRRRAVLAGAPARERRRRMRRLGRRQGDGASAPRARTAVIPSVLPALHQYGVAFGMPRRAAGCVLRIFAAGGEAALVFGRETRKIDGIGHARRIVRARAQGRRGAACENRAKQRQKDISQGGTRFVQLDCRRGARHDREIARRIPVALRPIQASCDLNIPGSSPWRSSNL